MIATLTRVAIYAAYGPNLDPSRMVQRCPHSPRAGTGWIQGWRLTFGGEEVGWDGSIATIVPAPSAATEPPEHVFVALYDITAYDERRLDSWEGVEMGLHRKLRLRVHTLTGDVLAWCYVLDAFEGGLPSAHYVGLLADAAESAGAPDDYVAELRRRPCKSLGS